MQKSFVWTYFTREGDKARCKVEGCSAVLTVKATSPLFYHLEKVHKIYKNTCTNSATNVESEPSTSHTQPLREKEAEPQHEEPQVKKQKMILDYFSYRTLEETVARMVAVDGLAIRGITQSSFIQESLAKMFPKHNIPMDNTNMMALVETFYAQKKDQLKQKISSLKTKGVKFSAALDEWKSLKNVRFMNINLNYSVRHNEVKYMNLGLVELIGSCLADHMLALFCDRLLEYGVDFKTDIVAATGDGASVMIPFGKKAPFEYVTCLNHTINLAVLEAVFTDKKITCQDDFEESDEEENDDNDVIHVVDETFRSTIAGMRAIIYFFRKFPVRNNLLQAELEKIGRKKLELVMFTKTRWDSLVISGKRFLDLLPAVLVTLNKLGDVNSWDEENTELLKSLILTLEPALIATEALSKDSINIIESEIIAESLVGRTSKLDSAIGKKFHKILVDKINERRNTSVTSLALYLLDQDYLSKKSTTSYPFKLESKSITQQFGIKLMQRLFEPDEGALNEPELSFQNVMKQKIEKRWGKASQIDRPSTGTSEVQKCFRSYDQHRQKSPLLEKLFAALRSIPPTSTQSERNFSLSGSFVTKLRTQLTPEHVDMLSFLKSYFLNSR